MSVLRNLPLKIIASISKMCLTKKLNFQNPYDNYEDNLEKITNVCAYFGVSVDSEIDVEFICEFIRENINPLTSWSEGDVSFQEISSDLTVPKLEKFKVYYQVWGPATLTEKYSTTWESYNPDWVGESVKYSWNDGSLDYWAGDYVEYETDNFEADNFEVDYVRPLNENKNSNVMSKLVLENTEMMLDSLDRETLLKLRNLINQKLSS